MTLTLEWINEDYYQDEGRIEKRIFKSNFELFIQAIVDSNFDYVTFYHKAGNTIRGFHDLPLKTAFKFNNPQIISYLLSNIMCEENRLDNSVLFEAVNKGYHQIGLNILKQNPKINMNKDWVVELAVTKGLSQYLDYFSQIDYQFIDNPNLLIKAVQYNQIDSIEKLLSFGIDIHYQNDVALKLAAAANYLDIVKLLVEKGADIKSSKALVLATPDVKKYLQSL